LKVLADTNNYNYNFGYKGIAPHHKQFFDKKRFEYSEIVC